MSGHHQHNETDDSALGDPELVEVARGVFAYIQPDGTWWINNTGFVVASDGVVLIDTCSTERRTLAMIDAIRVVTDQPIRTVVNTHHHGDHTHGNYLTHPATVVGHTLCRDAIIATGINHYDGVFEPVEWGDLQLAPPMLTFDDHVALFADDIRIELRHFGRPAHTTNDIVAWLPEQRVLYTGDLVFQGGTPFMLMGSILGSLNAVADLRTLDPDVVVPGHGPVCDSAAFDTVEGYIRFVLDVAQSALDDNLTPIDAARAADLGAFAELTDSERIVGNLHRAMHELGQPNGTEPLDLNAAISDMLIYNDGKPLRCIA